MANSDSPKLSRAQRRGRALGIAVYAALMVGVTANWGIQVMRQVWFPAPGPEISCQEGLAQMEQGLSRARARGWEQNSERLALQEFRAAVDEAWRLRPTLTRACAQSPQAAAQLLSLDRIRYDEEALLRLSVDSRRHAGIQPHAHRP